MSSPLKLDEAPWSPLSDYQKLDNSQENSRDVHVGGHDGDEPWLLSYADMVTLLMCFFILFFSTDRGNINIKDPARLMEQMQALEKMLGIENDLLPESDKFEYAKTSFDLQNLSAALGKESAFPSSTRKLIHSIGVPKPGNLEIVFLQDFFFASGASQLTREAKAALAKVVETLRPTLRNASIEVDGHTDSSTGRKGSVASNWELSGRRAASVIEYFEQLGLPSENLVFRGFGHHQPLMPEVDAKGVRIEKNMAVNRRVVIRVIEEGVGGKTRAQ